MRRPRIIFIALLLFLAHFSQGQTSFYKNENAESNGLFPKQAQPELNRYSIAGYYRFLGTYLQRDDNYLLNSIINDTAKQSTLFIGDDSQLPTFEFRFAGRPSSRASFNFDLYAFQFLDGQIGSAYGAQVPSEARPSIFSPMVGTQIGGNLNLLLGINVGGLVSTDYGTFALRMGGIHWTHLSDMTMAAFRGYNRFTLSERNPWDPIGKGISTRYESYFGEGNINQDFRWGERAFQGLILNGVNLPGDLEFQALFGKSELNGGFMSTPNFSYGGRVHRSWKNGLLLAANSFNSKMYTDSLNTDTVGTNTHTIEVHIPIGKFKFQAETGMSRYYDPAGYLNYNEVINLKLRYPLFDENLASEINFYRVGSDAVNNSSIFWNTSVREYNPAELPAGSIGSPAVLRPFASAIVPLGQPTNNRQGLTLNLEIPTEWLKFSLGAGFSSELEARSSQLSFSNLVNNLTHSRFWRWNFPTGVGPYERYNVVYRGTYQTLDINPSDGSSPTSVKHFSGLELQTKAKVNLGIRPLYIFVLNRFYSAQPEFSPITVFSEEAYLRQYSQEIEAYLKIRPKLILNSYFGIESVLGNYETVTNNDTGKPVNQRGYGFALGFDYELAKNTALFFRHRWFNFKDESFVLDQYKGQESMLELKIFF